MTGRLTERVTYSMLESLVPLPPDYTIEWDRIWSLWPQLKALDECPQDPVHHGEGDVGTHTRMVVEALVGMREWRGLTMVDRSCVFWAAVLHDIGKPATTVTEEIGRITSRGHSRAGASIARELLWLADAPFGWREQVCGIIAAHQLPFWLIGRPDPMRLAIETSCKCLPSLLCLHAMADAEGRVCTDKNAILEDVSLAKEVFREAGCLERAFPFANDESRVAYFEKPSRDPHYAAFGSYRCKVTLMSGLPGAGKDTWIARNRTDTPVVSLDALRSELGERATGNQGRVIQAAYERAREYLRSGQDFIWNGTNVTAQLRAKPLRLFRDYDAKLEIVYLEPAYCTLRNQNRERSAVVPEQVISNLVKKLEPPGDWEAHQVLRVVEVA